jgi:hypothetical protein
LRIRPRPTQRRRAGGQTKWNRRRFGIPKTHALDAATTGNLSKLKGWRPPCRVIQAAGQGCHAPRPPDEFQLLNPAGRLRNLVTEALQNTALRRVENAFDRLPNLLRDGPVAQVAADPTKIGPNRLGWLEPGLPERVGRLLLTSKRSDANFP